MGASSNADSEPATLLPRPLGAAKTGSQYWGVRLVKLMTLPQAIWEPGNRIAFLD